MSHQEQDSNYLDACVSRAIDSFSAMDSDPTVFVSPEGSLISAAATPYEAADLVLDDLSHEEKTRLLGELISSDRSFKADADFAFDEGKQTYRQVLHSLLQEIIVCEMIRHPDVIETIEDNLKALEDWREGS